jgi:hypothetical protein
MLRYYIIQLKEYQMDENYDDPSSPSRESPRELQQQSPDGIAGLDMSMFNGAIVPPPANTAETPRVRNGRVTRFRRNSPRSRSRSQSPDFGFNLDSFLNSNAEVNANADDFARVLSREQLRDVLEQAAPPPLTTPTAATMPSNVDVNRVVSSILEQTPQQRRQQQLERLLFRHRELITAIMRECPNVRIHRLIRLIAAIEREDLNESRLLEHLRQLERMLHMRRRTRTRQNVTVTNSEAFMSAFGRLDCRSSNRARRAFYALISQLRDQVVQRLDEMYQRRLRQAYPQSPQPQSKGGKRQTRKKSTKRNRTVKRR